MGSVWETNTADICSGNTLLINCLAAHWQLYLHHMRCRSGYTRVALRAMHRYLSKLFVSNRLCKTRVAALATEGNLPHAWQYRDGSWAKSGGNQTSHPDAQ
jgi:hypothetical protein